VPGGVAASRREARLSAARRTVLDARPLGIYYYLDDSQGIASLGAHASSIKLLAPQCFWIERDGTVRGSIPSSVLEVARRQGTPVMPLLYNPGFDRETLTAMLRSATAQERALAGMVGLARVHNLVGFQIDLENADPTEGRLLSAFVRRAAERMHHDGRLLSVALVPRFSDTPFIGAPLPVGAVSTQAAAGGPATVPPTALPATHVDEWAASFDYRTLGQVADFLVLMAYDHFNRNTAPGPIADSAWVKKALDYAVARVPPAKLVLGLPLYGREWIQTEKDISARTVRFKDIDALLTLGERRPQWDTAWRSPHLEFQDASGSHTIWFEDHRSLNDKLRLMREYRLRGFAAWRLGDDSPAFWNLVAKESARNTRIAVRKNGRGAARANKRGKQAPERGRGVPY
jgi:spore germination protein